MLRHLVSSASRLSVRRFQAQRVLNAEVTVVVPSLGDSITEATVIEWTKQIGEMVAEDDVLVVLETDKVRGEAQFLLLVTVDVRSTHAGVLVGQLAAAEDEITVGEPLAKLDDAGTATAEAPAAPVSAAAAPAAAAPAAAVAAPPTSHRVPMIKFKYGAGRAAEEAAAAAAAVAAQAAPPAAAKKAAAPKVSNHPADDAFSVPVMFGRLPMGEAEMEAIALGGAY